MSLDARDVFYAYTQGIFPMADDDGTILWFDPDPRAILPLDDFHVPQRLARTVRQEVFEIRVDTAFREVMEACAAPAPGREQTWISDDIIRTYTHLHHAGYAHSVETWQDGHLAGGLYGIAINSFFAGESMFHDATDASKVALVHLVRRLRTNGFLLLDIQFMTDHFRRFGAIEIPRAAYKRRLGRALGKENAF